MEMAHGVEELQAHIAGLVDKRQELRTVGASRRLLEQNRLELVRSQHDLSHALIRRYGVRSSR
jgi:hypothetical protein